MKVTASILLGILVIGLMMINHDSLVDSNRVSDSARKRTSRSQSQWGSQGSHLQELERSASSLSDEELWNELERECRNWLEAAKSGAKSRPPDWLVLLAREIGRRQGKEGVMAVIQLQETLEAKGGSGALADFEQKLWGVLVYGAFGGWSSSQPAEALTEVLRDRLDPFEEDISELPSLFMNPALVDGFLSGEFLVAERVLRVAFKRLVERDAEHAMVLLIQGANNLSLDPNQMVEVILPHLEPRQREDLFNRLSSQRIEQNGPGPFHPEIWSEDWSVLHGDHPTRDVARLTEVISRVMPDEGQSLISDPSINPKTRQLLAVWQFIYHPDQTEWIEAQSTEIQREILSSLSSDLNMFSFGPVDGQRQGLDDLAEFYQMVRGAIERSQLSAEDQETLIRQTEELAAGMR